VNILLKRYKNGGFIERSLVISETVYTAHYCCDWSQYVTNLWHSLSIIRPRVLGINGLTDRHRILQMH